MAVLINFKICDNSPDCGGLAACPKQAIYWDEKNNTLAIDNSKCSSCGLCETGCELGAIKVAKDETEYKKFQREIDEDPRRLTDLFVDRYGAQPVLTTFLLKESEFNQEKLQKLTAIELFNDDSIECLLKSIPISNLFKGFDINYFRVRLEGKNLKEKFCIKELPALVFFSKGSVIGKIEGYYTTAEAEELRSKVKSLIEKA